MIEDKSRKVLLIDDRWEEEKLVLLLENALQGGAFKWKIEPVADGREALKILSDSMKDVCDAVLLDLVMENQELQGHQLLPEIKKIDPSIPVIILSSKLEAAEVQRTLHHGAIFYCEKRLLTGNPVEIGPLINIILGVLEATQRHPEEREFQIRLGSLALDEDNTTEELRAAGRLLQRSLGALSMHTIHEFESTSRIVGISSSSSDFDNIRSDLLLGGSVLAACQAGDALLEELMRQAHQLSNLEQVREEVKKTQEYIRRKEDVGTRLARRTVDISVLQKLGKLSPWQTGALIMLTWFRDLVANPFLDHGLDRRSDAVFVLDLMLAVIEAFKKVPTDSSPHTARSLVTAMDELDISWRGWCNARPVASAADSKNHSYREWLEFMVESIETDPEKSHDTAVKAVRAVRSEVATQLQYLGASVLVTWDPMKDGSTKALEAFRSAAMSPLRHEFPSGVWGRSEKFFRCYGHTIEWLAESEINPNATRLTARACLAIFDWWVHDYLQWCEQVDWATKSHPRSVPTKKLKNITDNKTDKTKDSNNE